MEIFKADGTGLLNVTPSDSSSRYRELMGDDRLTLEFELTEYVDLEIGAYCTFNGTTYYLLNPANLTVVHDRNFKYSVTFVSAFERASRYKIHNMVDGRLKFDLTATPQEHLQMVIDNLNERDGSGTWTIGSCISGVETLISYNHVYCIDAIKAIADKFNTEFECVGTAISIHKVEYNKSAHLSLSYGKGNGFKTGVKRTNDGDALPIETVYVQGGNDNISLADYGSSELHLPESTTIKYDGDNNRFYGETGYVDTNAIRVKTDAGGLCVKRIKTDSADDYWANKNDESLDLTSIYPKRVGVVSNVRYIYNSAVYTYAELVQITGLDWDKVSVDIIDSSIPYNLDYESCRIGTQKMTIIFQSGMLAGREFDVQKYYHSAVGTKLAKRFELVSAEIDGVRMPNGTYRVYGTEERASGGDTYAIFGVSMPQAYIGAFNEITQMYVGAEYDMLRDACKYLYENQSYKFSFTGSLDGIYAKKNWSTISSKIKIGSYVKFNDQSIIEEEDGILVRILSIKDYVNKPYSPEIELSTGTAKVSVSSAITKLNNEAAHTEEAVNDARDYTDRSVAVVGDMFEKQYDGTDWKIKANKKLSAPNAFESTTGTFSGQVQAGSLLSDGGITAYASGSQVAGSILDSIPVDSTLDKSTGVLKVIGGSGTTDYDALSNRPQIAGVTLTGNKTLATLGIQAELNSGNKLSASLVSGLADVATSGSYNDLLNKPTTLSGYGITDAKIESGTITLGGNTITPLTAHQDISGKVDKVTGKGLSTNDFTTELLNKLNGIEAGANNYSHPTYNTATAAAVKIGRDATGHVVIGNALSKSDVGLGDVENTKLSTWTGSQNITTLGTITTGTWHGTAIANANLANSTIGIAGTSVSLGSSISAATIGNALTSSSPAAYATSAGNADTVDSLHESRLFRKNLINASADCNTMEDNSFTILNQDAGSLTCANKPSDASIAGGYGVLTVTHGSYKNQIFFPYSGNELFIRNKAYNTGAAVWCDWQKFYHSGNCNNTSTAWNCSSLTMNGALGGVLNYIRYSMTDTIVSAAGWYRVAQLNGTDDCTGLINISKSYSNSLGSGAIIAYSRLYGNGCMFNELIGHANSSGITAIRCVQESEYVCYLEVYYGSSTSNNIRFFIQGKGATYLAPTLQSTTTGTVIGSLNLVTGSAMNCGLTINGALSGATTGAFSQGVTIGGALNVTGAATFSGGIANAGTVSAGTWNGSTIGVAYGGTGRSTLTSGYALVGNGTSAVSLREILNQVSASEIGPSTSLVNANTIAYWNGAYEHGGSSRITHVGTLVSLNVSGAVTMASTLSVTGQTTVGSLISGAGITAYASASQTAGTILDNIPVDSTLTKTDGVLGVSSALLARITALETAVANLQA